jgi:hypothetical protein
VPIVSIAARIDFETTPTHQEMFMKSNRIVLATLLAVSPFVAHANGGPSEFYYDATARSTRTVAEVRAEAREAMQFGEAGQPLDQWAGVSSRTREEVKRDLATMPPVFQGA